MGPGVVGRGGAGGGRRRWGRGWEEEVGPGVVGRGGAGGGRRRWGRWWEENQGWEEKGKQIQARGLWNMQTGGRGREDET